jgi:hypothetical protein
MMNEENQQNATHPENDSENQQDAQVSRDRLVDKSQVNEVTNLNYVGGIVPGSMESIPRFVDEDSDRMDYLYRDEPEEEGYISSPENS